MMGAGLLSRGFDQPLQILPPGCLPGVLDAQGTIRVDARPGPEQGILSMFHAAGDLHAGRNARDQTVRSPHLTITVTRSVSLRSALSVTLNCTV